MKHEYTKKEKQYLLSFKDTTLDLNKFHHKKHIQITYILLIDNSINITYKNIKFGILNMLDFVKADKSKYNETITYGWILIINQYMKQTKKCNCFEEFISRSPELLNLDILYEYYSRELIKSEKARVTIQKPDIKDFTN